MRREESKIEKLCSFYVSDWHLVTMLLPYIHQELEKEANIVTILENSFEENIKIMLSKLRLKNEKEIMKINWNNVNIKNYNEMQNRIEKIYMDQKNINIVFISGSKEYIKEVHDAIYRQIEELSTKLKNTIIKIVDCYEISEFNGNMKQILDEHDKMLNTTGEKEITEVFDGYCKVNEVG